jgi:hypothetical protein
MFIHVASRNYFLEDALVFRVFLLIVRPKPRKSVTANKEAKKVI